MRFLKFLALTLVVALGLNSCKPNGGDGYDHSSDLAGTWTCLTENYAEALIINADGSAVSYGVEDGEYWENVAGNIVVENGNITMTFEDGDNFEGHFDIIPGMAFSIFTEDGEHMTYNYCKEDLSDEIVGMWVCTQIPIGKPEDMLIHTFQEDGTLIITGRIPEIDDYVVVGESNYKVFGDLYIVKGKEEGKALVFKFNVASNASDLGDMMAITGFMPTENGVVEETSSWIRVKQNLELPGQKYDYIKTFVTNVKGVDKDIDVMGYTFNFAKMDGVILDKMLKTVLFAVEFPSADTIRYSCHYDEFDMEMDAPIVVDGNKMTVKMSVRDAAYKDVDLYTFQDQDNTQMHMYMHSTAFINFFGNMQVAFMSELGQLDKTDAAAVKAIYDSIDAAVESINLSLVMTKSGN